MSAVSVASVSRIRGPGVFGWIQAHPLISFFVIAFIGEWVVMLPLVLAQNGLGLLSYTIPEPGLFPLSYWFAVPAALFGPTLASWVVTAIIAGKAGMKNLAQRYMLWRVGARWYLLVLVGVPVIQIVGTSLVLGAAALTTFAQQWQLYFTVYLPNVLLIAIAIQLWEEGGWSGFAIPHLQNRFGPWRACLVFGPLWALFHLPFFFVPGQIFASKVGAGTVVTQMVLLIIVATLLRFSMTWVFNNTKASILIAILLHSALDASNSASAYITQLLAPSQIKVYALMSALVIPLFAAILLLILTRGHLSYHRERHDLEKPAEEAVGVY